MPEQCELFLQGPRSLRHPLQPPAAEINHILSLGALDHLPHLASLGFELLPFLGRCRLQLPAELPRFFQARQPFRIRLGPFGRLG